MEIGKTHISVPQNIIFIVFGQKKLKLFKMAIYDVFPSLGANCDPDLFKIKYYCKIPCKVAKNNF